MAAGKRYASLGQRAIALIIDGILLGFIGVVLMTALVGNALMTGDITSLLLGWLFIMVVTWLYYILLEGLYGTTIGKKLIGIKVVDDRGRVPGIVPALIRNVLRIVDILPQFYIIGIVLIFTNDDNQRLGDMVGGTYVVRA
jgi:uncharacterized RDD family membrane protein YckC